MGAEPSWFATEQSRRYQSQVGAALDAALQRASAQELQEQPKPLNLATDRYIIFSDMHRGIHDRADDFLRAERAYNAALAYYFELGYTLVALGDVEELWEERPKPALEAYTHTLELEAQFHKARRYLRFWGNHDDEWRYEGSVQKYLAPYFRDPSRPHEPPLKVHECLKIPVQDDSQPLGTLFLVHGHQGTTDSDRFSAVSRLFVRYVWRPFQRFTGASLNTPAKDWQLREQHNIALYEWAKKQSKLILIAGHTHRPVFKSQSHATKIRKDLDLVIARLQAQPIDPALQKEAGELAAELEWVLAQERQQPGMDEPVDMDRPCYFNTGCCCFLDGDITGIEIVDGEIRLVRWPNDQDRPQPQILERAGLRIVFATC